MPVRQLARRKPRLHQDHTAGVHMPLEAPERTLEGVERLHVTDRAEHADHGVVTTPEVEVDHVGNLKTPGWILGLRKPHELRVQVDAVNLEAMMQTEQPRML